MSNIDTSVATKIAAPYQHPSSGVVVLLKHGDQESVSAFGNLGVSSACPPQDVLFEIGSITKVFTALLLAKLAEEGALDPNSPIRELCAEFSGMQDWVTPTRLATHTSGLPRLHIPVWKLLLQRVPDDPYAAFSRDDLVSWMQNWRPRRPPKETRHAYSNLGFGLLGEVLAIHQKKNYEDLLKEKVLDPLGLHDTAIILSKDQQKRFAEPHSPSGKPVIPWTFQAMAGAGALRASAQDLARFLGHVARAVGHPTTELDRAIAETARPIVGLGPRKNFEPVSQCLGWVAMRLSPDAPRLLFHDGGTAGSSSAVYVCPEKNASIVVLANRGVEVGLWSSLKLSWSNLHRVASDHFAMV